MFFETAHDCAELATSLGFNVNLKTRQLHKPGLSAQGVQINFADSKLATYAIAQQVTSWFGPSRRCLLWITEFGIWPSSENLHLYYKLRHSYCDYRELHVAPGHLFLSHEQADLISFIDLTLQFGWGGFLFGIPNDNFVTISHDEWILFESAADVDSLIQYAEEFTLPYSKTEARPSYLL